MYTDDVARKSREREFQNSYYKADKKRAGRQFRKVVSSVTDSAYRLYLASLLPKCRDHRVLEIGSGAGEKAMIMAEHGARVTGIDISDEKIVAASQLGAYRGSSAEFKVMDAESLDFGENAFDVVCGEGVLHHLDLQKVIPEICRVLKPDGAAFFTEPLAANPVLKAFRWLTPKMRSPDEHPLTSKDLEFIRSSFESANFRFFNMVTPLALIFYPLHLHRAVARSLNRLESFTFHRVPRLELLAWSVLLCLERPQKTKAS
jgi:2-polyprenyl-3-methyl-5-hydroxy-6-metoxy-1,4-benzoquinol methylase